MQELLINADILKRMLAMQERLNVKYNGEEWRDKVKMTKVKLAILDEVSEFLREIEATWKWWKHDPTYNRQKALYELIDLVHFGLLAMLHRYDLEGLTKRIEVDMHNVVHPTHVGSYSMTVLKQEFFMDALLQFLQLIDDTEQDYRNIIYLFCNLVQAGGELIGVTDPQEIYTAYVMKNQRNHERVDGGVMVGTYDKSKESELPSGK